MAHNFGSSVSVYRTDGDPPQQTEEALIAAAARALTLSGSDRMNPFAGIELVVGSCQDMDYIEGVDLRLTSYFVADDDNEARQEVTIAEDEEIARQFAAALQDSLGEEYRVDSYSGAW